MIESGDDSDQECPVAIPLQVNICQVRSSEKTEDLPQLSNNKQPRASKVPVTILTGCLGAGKTTLLNRILKDNHGYRIAVVMNELGEEKGIENVALDRGNAEGDIPGVEEWIELSNGCVCCNVKNDLLIALEGLLQKHFLFDYIIIETTGVANPGPVAASLWVDDALESQIVLDAVVTVVDSKLILKQLNQTQEQQAEKQIAYADVLILNKTDLVDISEVAVIEDTIRRINSSVKLHVAERCNVDVGILLNQQNYQTRRIEVQQQGHHHGSSSEHQQGNHISQVATISIHIDSPLDLNRLKSCLDSLLWEQKEIDAQDIYRMKGVLCIRDMRRKYVLQAVHDLYEIVEGQQEWQSDESRISRIVVIGKALNKIKLQQLINQCTVD